MGIRDRNKKNVKKDVPYLVGSDEQPANFVDPDGRAYALGEVVQLACTDSGCTTAQEWNEQEMGSIEYFISEVVKRLALEGVVPADEIEPEKKATGAAKSKKAPEAIVKPKTDPYRGKGGAYVVGEDGVRIPKV